jgi:hypothetical protein
MLSALLTAATVSKAPFYIAGGVLALYAVVLAGIGITRPSFPFSQRGARGVMLLSLVLVLITIAMAIKTSTFE